MFKSPAKGIPAKKSPISFIKTAVSPRQAQRALQMQTSKSISTVENDFTIDHFSKSSSTSILSLEVTLEKPTRLLRFAFPFSN
jgi:hypothetical protein